MELVADLTLVLAAALVGGLLAQRLRQPLIVGYIVAGVVVGPVHRRLHRRTHVDGIEQLAELGVALLLFSLGLEVSFRELTPVRAVAIGGGDNPAGADHRVRRRRWPQASGWAWQPALWFGALISLSSTMVALKTLQAQGRLGTLSSRVMLGMLVVQDLAVVPLMIVLPELSNPAGGITRVLLATGARLRAARRHVFWSRRARAAVDGGRGAVELARAVPARDDDRRARRRLRRLSRSACRSRSGAFIAGLVINESEYAHQALSDVIPLRDLFGMLFFVSVGMLLDPALVWAHLGTLAIVVGAVVGGQSGDFRRRRPRVRLPTGRPPRRRADALPGRRVRVRPRAQRRPLAVRHRFRTISMRSC